MSEGLEINTKQFTKLPVKQQNAILWENSKRQLEIMENYVRKLEDHELSDEYQFKGIKRQLAIGASIIATLFGGIIYIVFDRLKS